MIQTKAVSITITRSQALALLGALVSLGITALTIMQFHSLRQSSASQQWQIEALHKEVEELNGVSAGKIVGLTAKMAELQTRADLDRGGVQALEAEIGRQRAATAIARAAARATPRGPALVEPVRPVESSGAKEKEREQPQPFILGPPLKEIKP